MVAFFIALPLADLILPGSTSIAEKFRTIFLFAILGLGLNLITGSTGLLNLGTAAFMAIGAYTYALSTCAIYPFQTGFWFGCLLALMAGLIGGAVLCAPVLRLRGDYLAVVTLGFGEIVQDSLKNLDVVTKGTQGINPLPPPSLFSYTFRTAEYLPWYYLFLGILIALIVMQRNLESSRFGRKLLSLREDELAARCVGINGAKTKLFAFSLGSACCALAGALWVSFLGTSGEPGNFDFQLSVIVLCIVVVGGLGSVKGVLIGSVVMLGFNSILLARITAWISGHMASGSQNVLLNPVNWKYLIFGLVLILMMRFRPQGILPADSDKMEAR